MDGMRKLRWQFSAALVGVLLGLAGAASAQGQWVTHPTAAPGKQTVLHFRKEVDLKAAPKTYPIRITADNRFILYVNGQRVAEGPSRGDLKHWRVEAIDLSPYLKAGHNVVAAEVWNAAEQTGTRMHIEPLAQLSARTAFWVEGEGAARDLDTSMPWQVSVQEGHTFSSPFPHLMKELGPVFYAAGSAEDIDGTKVDWDWKNAQKSSANWVTTVPALAQGEASPWTLVADALPQMSHDAKAAGKVVRTDFKPAGAFPSKPVTVPANTTVTLLLDQNVVQSAYPEFLVTGGKDATVTVTYSEALYDAEKHKGDRSEIGDRQAIGIEDTFHLDGGKSRTYRPLWWRTWRYMQIQIKTGDAPFTLNGVKLYETGYPYETKGYFKSNDAELNKIWQIGWQTVKVDAHETFMDSSYWEQLQYVGDTRIDNVISYTVTGDPRLAIQAIDAYGDSQGADGMIQSAYPSSTDNVIPPFGLLWLGMMHDYVTYQPDLAVIHRNIAGGRKILDWYAPYVAANGLVTITPKWNYIDWAGEAQAPYAKTEFDRFPSFDPATQTSCLVSLVYLGGLKDMAAVEVAAGDASLAQADQKKAADLTDAIRTQCWDAHRGLFADSPTKAIFSQHTNALAVLYDVAPKDQAADILKKVTKPDGIDAPDGMLTTSYYFSWYLIKAYKHAGLSDRYLTLIDTWRDLAKLNFTTWPEARGETRSDTHAWSSHPTADLIGIVAGIQPGAPGYAAVDIEPHLGALTSVDASATTPKGLVSVSYRKTAAGAVDAVINKPSDLPGKLVWRGKAYPLTGAQSEIQLPQWSVLKP